LEKRATVIDSLREKEKNLLLIDIGDILGVGLNPRRHTYIVRAYKYLKYDILAPGDQDFIEGKDYFFESVMPSFEHTLDTNFFIEGQLYGEKYIIKQYGNVRIGFIATISPEVEKYISPYRRVKVTIENQISTIRTVINEIKDICNIIVLLSHSGYDIDVDLAEKFPEISMIIGGHSQTLLAEPAKINDTYIMQAGNDAYRLGIIKIYFESNKIDKLTGHLILLDEKIDNHPEIMKMIEDYNNKIKY